MFQLPRLYPNARKHLGMLARSFPSLSDADGDKPFNPYKLDSWAQSTPPRRELMARHAALFLLQLRDPNWCPKFDVFEALADWDLDHRRAFLAWAEDPWWPRSEGPRFSVGALPPGPR